MNQALPLLRHLMHPRYWLTWAGVGLLALLAWLPWKVRSLLAGLLGKGMYRYNRKRRQVVLVNLEQCFPEYDPVQRDQLARAHFHEYAHALLDYSLLFFRSRTGLYRRIDLTGQEHIDRAVAAHQNVILMVAHSVWLEFAGVGLGKSYELLGFYKPFRNPVVNWLITRSRSQDAETLVARGEGMMKLVRMLQPGRLLFFLPDEDHGIKASVFAPFFGVPKATLTTPGRLSKLGKAAALPVMAFRQPDTQRYQVVIGEPLESGFPNLSDVDNAVQLNKALEALIRQYPAHYMWTLKLFRTRPPEMPGLY